MRRLQAKVQESQVLQAEALLQHGFFLRSAHDLLCNARLRSPGDLLCDPSVLLHGFDRLLLGSRCNLLRSAVDLLHSGCHVLLGSCQLLCARYRQPGCHEPRSRGLTSACQ